VYSSGHPYASPSQRRWGAISWWYSLFLIIPLLAILITIIWTQFISGTSVQGNVFDAYTGDPIEGAVVQFGDRETTTSNDGSFGIRSDDAGLIEISLDGYESTQYELPANDNEIDPDDIEIALRPNVMQGVVFHRMTDEPMADVLVEAVVDEQSVSSTETSADGSFVLNGIPEGAELRFSYAEMATLTEPIDSRTEISVTMRPGVISGTVTDEDGAPIPGATIAIGDVWTETSTDGTYRIENAPESGFLMYKSPGYHALAHELDDQMEIDVTLTDKHIRSIYVSAAALADEAKFNELLDLVERTELNSMVVDIKDSTGLIFYDTEVELAHEIDAVRPLYDVQEVLDQLHERGIYVIARQVIFEDPALAEARNEFAIQNSEGGLWRTWNDIAWLSAYEEEVWDYNIELMLEAVELGFDEIQLDYMRFPSDGPLDQADYGIEEHNEETRVAAITGFLERSHEAIMPTRAYLGGDIFGLALWELGDGGIGQNLEAITPYLDYIKPMIYPSHFYPGSMGFDIPNDHPYEVILYSLENAAQRIPDDVDKLRPWLQDFSHGEGREYGPDEVRLQIDASDDFGATGWMLWSASNNYQEDALEPAANE
jgi:hypothetical protein